MSTTVVIEPAVPESRAGGAVLVPLALLAGTGLWAAVRALTDQDDTSGRLLEKSREQLREERWATMTLRSTDLDRFTRSAREARYLATPVGAGGVRLTAERGAAVWAARTPEGLRLVGTEASLRQLAVANTTSRAAEFLRARGFRVEAMRTKTGETCLVGRSPDARAVSIGVAASGAASVDPVGFKGPECDGFVRDLSAALEGSIVQASRKPEYFGAASITPGAVRNG